MIGNGNLSVIIPVDNEEGNLGNGNLGLDHRVGHFMSMMFQIRGESTPSGFQIRIAIGERSRHP